MCDRAVVSTGLGAGHGGRWRLHGYMLQGEREHPHRMCALSLVQSTHIGPKWSNPSGLVQRRASGRFPSTHSPHGARTHLGDRSPTEGAVLGPAAVGAGVGAGVVAEVGVACTGARTVPSCPTDTPHITMLPSAVLVGYTSTRHDSTGTGRAAAHLCRGCG